MTDSKLDIVMVIMHSFVLHSIVPRFVVKSRDLCFWYFTGRPWLCPSPAREGLTDGVETSQSTTPRATTVHGRATWDLKKINSSVGVCTTTNILSFNDNYRGEVASKCPKLFSASPTTVIAFAWLVLAAPSSCHRHELPCRHLSCGQPCPPNLPVPPNRHILG